MAWQLRDDARADTEAFAALALEANDDRGAVAGLVLVEYGWRFEVVHQHIEVAVAIKVCQGGAVGDGFEIESPSLADVFEGQVLGVAQRDVLLWHRCDVLDQRDRGLLTPFLP